RLRRRRRRIDVPRRSGRGLAVALVAGALGVAACKPAPPTSPVGGGPTSSNDTVRFRYDGVDGIHDVSSEATLGRVTVVAFLATYDLASQAQARFLSGVARHHRPHVQAAAVLLEPRENRPLVLGFRDALHLEYPV